MLWVYDGDKFAAKNNSQFKKIKQLFFSIVPS